MLENGEEVQTESPDLLNCWQLCSLQGVSENSHLQGNPACLLQITIQSCGCLCVLNTKKQKPLLTASSSHTALFILLMRMVGAILGHFGSVLYNCSCSENQTGKGMQAVWGGAQTPPAKRCHSIQQMCICLIIYVLWLVGHMMIYGPQCSLHHQSRNITVDYPVC